MALRRFLFQADEAYHDVAALADETQLAKITLTGSGGISVDAGGQRIVSVGTPTTGTDAANKTYVDNAISGVSYKEPVKVATTGNVSLSAAPNTVDGIALAANDRILVKSQTDSTQNGIYTVQTLGTGANGVWVRSSDMAAGSTIKGMTYVLVGQGSAAADTGWVVSTDGTITVGTTAISWTQFSGLGQVTAGSGLTKTSNTLAVGKGDGIAVGADDVSIDLNTNPALALTGTSPNKKLEWFPDTTRGLNKDASGAYVRIPAANPGLAFSSGDLDVKVDANGGILKDANGIGVKIVSTDRLSKSSSGLDVVGVPGQFEINGTATSTNVTAANLNTLTGGGNADALHIHSAAEATETPKVQTTWTASGALAKGDGVYINGTDTVAKGNASAAGTSRIIGVATAAISAAASGKIISSGVLTGVLSGATAGDKYFLGTTGQPVLVSSLASGNRTIQLGIAKNATDLFVQIIDFGVKS